MRRDASKTYLVVNALIGTLLLAAGIVQGILWLTVLAALGLLVLVPVAVQARARARGREETGEGSDRQPPP